MDLQRRAHTQTSTSTDRCPCSRHCPINKPLWGASPERSPSQHLHHSQKPARARQACITAAGTTYVDREGRAVSDIEVLNHRVEGFRSFHLEGCEFFVPEDARGRLDLTAAWITPWDTEEPRQAELRGIPPPAALRYKEAVWMSKYDGDMVFYKPAETRIERIYLIAFKEDGSNLLDFNQVFRLDYNTQNIRREAVRWNTKRTNPMEHVFRIRDKDILVEDLDNTPSAEDIVQQYEDSIIDETVNEMREKEKEAMDSTTLSDPIESRKDTEMDENSPEDTPASDMI